MLVVDPASGGSSLPGFAAYRAGQLIKSGTLAIDGGPVQGRLRALHEYLKNTKPDVLVIERIGGPKAHKYLLWSVGVIIAAANPMSLIEIGVSTWKKHAREGGVWTKGDENDALAMGACVLDVAMQKKSA